MRPALAVAAAQASAMAGFPRSARSVSSTTTGMSPMAMAVWA